MSGRARDVCGIAVHAAWNARLVLRRAGLDVFRPILACWRAIDAMVSARLVLRPTLLVMRTTIFVLPTTRRVIRRTIFALGIAFQSTEVATSAIRKPIRGWRIPETVQGLARRAPVAAQQSTEVTASAYWREVLVPCRAIHVDRIANSSHVGRCMRCGWRSWSFATRSCSLSDDIGLPLRVLDRWDRDPSDQAESLGRQCDGTRRKIAPPARPEVILARRWKGTLECKRLRATWTASRTS